MHPFFISKSLDTIVLGIPASLGSETAFFRKIYKLFCFFILVSVYVCPRIVSILTNLKTFGDDHG